MRSRRRCWLYSEISLSRASPICMAQLTQHKSKTRRCRMWTCRRPLTSWATFRRKRQAVWLAPHSQVRLASWTRAFPRISLVKMTRTGKCTCLRASQPCRGTSTRVWRRRSAACSNGTTMKRCSCRLNSSKISFSSATTWSNSCLSSTHLAW